MISRNRFPENVVRDVFRETFTRKTFSGHDFQKTFRTSFTGNVSGKHSPENVVRKRVLESTFRLTLSGKRFPETFLETFSGNRVPEKFSATISGQVGAELAVVVFRTKHSCKLTTKNQTVNIACADATSLTTLAETCAVSRIQYAFAFLCNTNKN